MPRRIGAGLVLLLFSTLALAGPTEDALAAYQQFFARFTTNNHEQMAALFAPDAQFYGTSSSELVTTPDGAQKYFAAALSGARGEVRARAFEPAVLQLSDTVVVISGKWHTERTQEGKTVSGAPLRNSVVLQKRGERWLIVQFHNSPTPKPPAAAK